MFSNEKYLNELHEQPETSSHTSRSLKKACTNTLLHSNKSLENKYMAKLNDRGNSRFEKQIQQGDITTTVKNSK